MLSLNLLFGLLCFHYYGFHLSDDVSPGFSHNSGCVGNNLIQNVP